MAGAQGIATTYVVEQERAPVPIPSEGLTFGMRWISGSVVVAGGARDQNTTSELENSASSGWDGF
jgi:hypothetical protein